MTCGQVTESILDGVQVFDQQVSPPRRLAEKGAYLIQGRGVHLASLVERAPLSTAVAVRPAQRVDRALPAGGGRVDGSDADHGFLRHTAFLRAAIRLQI